ncbi:ORF151 [Leucania separata nucleopolyhedrovirus]|uniref:ORF151 n=1 Tax=Leucania separata nucleopolyhedrovirus TaxID=1307956 RepID=Q0IKW8_NPVLS|nr:ORF151 [Leucania separata nucleopolyhedrovirus]AAR28915.1 ORF151 [Leucania separata nucleopolyhedrovirus]
MNLRLLFNLCALISFATDAKGQENRSCHDSSNTTMPSLMNGGGGNASDVVIDDLLDELINEVSKLENEEVDVRNYTKLTLFALLLIAVIFIKIKCARLIEWLNRNKKNRNNENITIQELNYNIIDHEHPTQPVHGRTNRINME